MRPLILVSILYTRVCARVYVWHKQARARKLSHIIYIHIYIYRPRAPAGAGSFDARSTPVMIQALFLGKLATAAHRVQGRQKLG
jgi:hypothetical protein